MDIEKLYYNSPDNELFFYFPNNLNESISNIILKKETKHMIFCDEFNKSIDNINLPQGLLSLIFGFEFNQSLDNVKFPDSLRRLSLLGKFNQSLDNVKILENIEMIEFGHMFDHSLSNINFNNLLIMTVGNNNILKTLKFSPLLEIIEFTGSFTTSLENFILPNTIKSIYFQNESSQIFDFDKIKFPSSLKKLFLPIKKIDILNYERLVVDQKSYYFWKNFNNLPDTLEELQISHISENITNLPLSLKKIFTINNKKNLNYFKKIPFGCNLYDINTGNIIDLDNVNKNIENIENTENKKFFNL